MDCDLWWKVEFTWQLMMTSSVAGQRISSKALPKAKLAPKIVLVTGGLLFIWSTTAFWISAHPLHRRSMLSKSIRCTENLLLALVNRKGPILLHNDAWPHITQPMLQTLKKLGYKVLPHPPYLFWPLTNWLPLLQASRQLFSGKMLLQPARGRKCFPTLHQIPKHTFFFFFMLQE